MKGRLIKGSFQFRGIVTITNLLAFDCFEDHSTLRIIKESSCDIGKSIWPTFLLNYG